MEQIKAARQQQALEMEMLKEKASQSRVATSSRQS